MSTTTRRCSVKTCKETTMHKVIQAHVTQNAFCYEVRMTSKKPDAKWRSNHVIMAVASSVQDAIAMCVAQYPDDPIIDQVVLRNRSMDLILSGDIVETAK
jgi:hypothetical protein